MNSIKILFSIIGNLGVFVLDIVFFLLIRIYFNIKIIGQYGVIFSFFMIFSFITTLGISVTYLKTVSSKKNAEDIAICNGTYLFFKLIQFLMYIVLILIFLPFGPLYEINFVIFCFFFYGCLLALLETQVFQYLLVKKKQIFKKSISLIVPVVIKLILLIIFVRFLTLNILLLAIIYFISNLTVFIVNIVFIKGIQIKIPNKEYIMKFLRETYPLFILTSLFIITKNIDVILVHTWFSVEEVANYFTAKQIYDFFLAFSFSITIILLPIFSKNIVLGRSEENLEIMKKIHQILNLIAVPSFFLILLYSTDVMVFLFGESYKLTGLILSILSFNLIIISIDIAIGIQLKALGEDKLYASMLIFQNLLAIVLMIYLMSPKSLNLGAIGGAIAIVISSIITQIIFRPIIYIKFGLGVYWGAFRNIFLMFIIYILQLYINQHFSYPIYWILIFGLLNLGLYFFLTYLFKGYSKEDIKFLLTIFNLKNIKESILLEFKEI